MKIVIVDDNESMRALLRAIAEGEGHEVVAEFADGNGLVEHVTGQPPDVVCLDYELPGSDGLELLVAMGAAANPVDVVMITGSADPELKGHAADLGATGFIRKPFDQAQVVEELREIAQARSVAARAADAPEPATGEAAGDVAAPPAPEPAPAPALEPVPAPEPPKPGPAQAPAAPPAEATAGVVPRTAVVVDDSSAIRLLMKGILSELGLRVVGAASNARDGIAIVGSARPAVVCLDVDMPGMSGLEALPLMHAASPGSAVVMVTGNAGRAIVEAAIAGGARGYFLKPVRPARVAEFMTKLLRL